MNETVLTGIAGVMLSVLFEYLPGLSDWYNKLKDNYQRLIMLALLAIATGAIYLLNCAGWISDLVPTVSCDERGIQQLIWMLVIAVTSNQGTHRILPR